MVKRNADVILVQEPIVLYKESKSIILSKEYTLFSPLENWTAENPCLFIYMKSGLRTKALPKRLKCITGVLVEGIDMYNMYLPPKKKTESKTVRTIIKIQKKKNEIIMGDFNRAFMWN